MFWDPYILASQKILHINWVGLVIPYIQPNQPTGPFFVMAHVGISPAGSGDSYSTEPRTPEALQTSSCLTSLDLDEAAHWIHRDLDISTYRFI